MPEDEVVKVSGEIPRNLYEEMVECCDREGRKIKYYIERGIRLAIDENK